MAPTVQPAAEAVPTIVAGVTAQAEQATPVPLPTMAPTETAGADSYNGLRDSIEKTLKDLNGEWGIGVQNLATGETLLINAGRPYPAASLYKLLVMYEAYRQIDAGTIDLDQITRMQESDYSDSLMWDEELQIGDRVSIKGLLRVLVIQSSNAAAHALERIIGLRSINGPAQQLGMVDTRQPIGEMAGRFTDWRATQGGTSVPDLMSFYGMLYRGELVSKQASEEMLELLRDQQINDRIPALLPRGVDVAHKTGNLPGVVVDAGIIFGPVNDVILIVLNQGADYEPGTEAIGEIGKLVYNWHNR